jgi:chromosome segregation ATPase
MATKKEIVTELFTEQVTDNKLVEEIASVKKQLADALKSNQEITANEHNVRRHLEKAEEELKKIVNLEKHIADLVKSNEEIIANEHNVRKSLEKAEQEILENKKIIDAKTKEAEALKIELTKLANLFDEYINAYQDQNKMLGVFFKNAQTVEKYLATKIEEFNGGNKK